MRMVLIYQECQETLTHKNTVIHIYQQVYLIWKYYIPEKNFTPKILKLQTIELIYLYSKRKYQPTNCVIHIFFVE